MSYAATPICKPPSSAICSLISRPTIFSAKTPYPFILIPSNPIKIQHYCSFYSSISSSFSLKKKTHLSNVVPCAAQATDWAQQENSTAVIEDEEANSDNPEVNDPEPTLSYLGSESEDDDDEVDDEDDDEDDEEDEDEEEEESVAEGSYAVPPEGAKLHVGNLPYDVNSEKLAYLFQKAGIVDTARILYSRATDQSRGFGYVTMSTVEEADKAVRMLHRYNLDGRLLTVTKAAPMGAVPARPPRFSGPFHRIHVGGLAYGVDNNLLKQVFSEHGKVLQARVVYNRETGRSRGFGFVTMSTEAELNEAVAKLDGQILEGRKITVSVSEERPGRSSSSY